MAGNYSHISDAENKNLRIILDYYDLDINPAQIEFTRNTVAFINKVYCVESLNKKNVSCKFILRESRDGTNPEHILLEAEVLEYLHKNPNFYLTAYIIKNKQDEYVTERNNKYYTLQPFMSGELKGSWDNLDEITDLRLENFFKASAQFSKAVQGFTTSIKTENIALANYLEKNLDGFYDKLDKFPDSPGKVLFEKYSSETQAFIKQVQTEFIDVDYAKLPKQIVHFDFHPGNVHFNGDEVMAIFDFDWVRFDSRITDIAGTIAQSCYYYGGPNDAKYRKDRVQAGLKAYRAAYGESEYDLKTEQHLIKIALKGYLIFQFFLTTDEYIANLENPEYFIIFKHFLKILHINDYDDLFAI